MDDIRKILNSGKLGTLADLAKKVKLGNMLSLIKVTVASLSADDNPDITSAEVLAAATVEGITLDDGEMLPAIGQVVSLRVTTSGTAGTVGTYVVSDDGGSAVSATTHTVAGIALLDDDGKTITFPTSITGFEIHYYPRAAVPLDTEWPPVSG